MSINKIVAILISIFLIYSCTSENEKSLPLSKMITLFTLSDFYKENKVLESVTDSIYDKMTAHDKISQLIITSQGEGTNTPEQINKLIEKGLTGGLVFLGKNKELVERIMELQNMSKWPLLMSLDAEPSLINGRLTDTNRKFKNTRSAKDVLEVEEISMEIAEILNNLGIHQNYAPVSDLGTNKMVINKRSYGNDAKDVINKSNAFITEHQASGVISTAKHFPGHGKAKGDSHKKLVSIDDVNEELSVFESNIKNEVLSIMVGHIAIKEGEYQTNNMPTTISRKVITGLLRNKLKFEGLIITDAMNMKGVTQFKNADFRALEAGVDLVLMPQNPKILIKQVKKALLTSVEFDKQIEKSVKRVIRLKLCLGLFTIDHIS